MPKFIGLSGSLRAGSFNTALLRAAGRVAPDGTTIEIASIRDVPLYDGDFEAEHGQPEPVVRLKDRIASADGLLIASPEYNHSIPGVAKNAIDWLSRPPSDIDRVFGGRPVALAGVSPGAGGTRMAHLAWLPIFHTLRMRPWFGQQLYVSGAARLFDDEGNLTDADTRERLARFIRGFTAFTGELIAR